MAQLSFKNCKNTLGVLHTTCTYLETVVLHQKRASQFLHQKTATSGKERATCNARQTAQAYRHTTSAQVLQERASLTTCALDQFSTSCEGLARNFPQENTPAPQQERFDMHSRRNGFIELNTWHGVKAIALQHARSPFSVAGNPLCLSCASKRSRCDSVRIARVKAELSAKALRRTGPLQRVLSTRLKTADVRQTVNTGGAGERALATALAQARACKCAPANVLVQTRFCNFAGGSFPRNPLPC